MVLIGVCSSSTTSGSSGSVSMVTSPRRTNQSTNTPLQQKLQCKLTFRQSITALWLNPWFGWCTIYLLFY